MVEYQNGLSDKIIYLLSKLSQIIRHTYWEVNRETGLSPLMLQILEYLLNNKRELCTPHKIAEDLGVKRPTITDSLKVLIKKGYVKEKPSEKDKRYKFLSITEKGKNLMEINKLKLESILKDSFNFLSEEEKEIFFVSLSKFISDLNKKGLLPVAKVCLSCKNFEENKFFGSDKPHYCRLLNIRMKDYELNVNCEENVFVNK